MFKIITVPFERNARGFEEELLNSFVINKQVKNYRAELFQDGGETYWTVFLEYDPLVERATESDTSGLDDGQKVLLDRLRAWRKETAQKAGVPVYIVATNRELCDIVKTSPRSLEALKAIKGFGKGKVAKYGKDVVEIIQAFYEKS